MLTKKEWDKHFNTYGPECFDEYHGVDLSDKSWSGSFGVTTEELFKDTYKAYKNWYIKTFTKLGRALK